MPQFKRPPKKKPQRQSNEPRELTDTVAKSIFKANPPTLTDGPMKVEGVFVGWKRTDRDTLGAIFANPVTRRRFLYGISFNTGRPMKLTELPQSHSRK